MDGGDDHWDAAPAQSEAQEQRCVCYCCKTLKHQHVTSVRIVVQSPFSGVALGSTARSHTPLPKPSTRVACAYLLHFAFASLPLSPPLLVPAGHHSATSSSLANNMTEPVCARAPHVLDVLRFDVVGGTDYSYGGIFVSSVNYEKGLKVVSERP